MEIKKGCRTDVLMRYFFYERTFTGEEPAALGKLVHGHDKATDTRLRNHYSIIEHV
jgi:hypothetical protein